MKPSKKTKQSWEFGDFQTPDSLAIQVTDVLQRLNFHPLSVIEPTCGRGSLLVSAIKTYPDADRYIGVDINALHLKSLKNRLDEEGLNHGVDLLHADFFSMDWNSLLVDLREPFLIIGNPPWVTSSELSLLQSSNLPKKSNFQKRNGMEAMTGKSNFDISEWMLLQHLAWMQDKTGMIAMLCKTAVARKVLTQAWQKHLPISLAHIYKIDAKRYFNAAVDACLFVIQFIDNSESRKCMIFDTMTAQIPMTTLGCLDDMLLSNVTTYKQLRCLRGEDKNYTWRSGIKHDCARVMELSRVEAAFVNGDGDRYTLEEEFLYPLLKSSDISNGRIAGRLKYMLVTQRYVGEDTSRISSIAPKTWSYLQANREALAKRGSSIYKKRPDFSIFGVGDYTFAPWKVAISGFYKRLNYVVVAPIDDRPVVFDDTVYFLACASEREATFVYELLNSDEAKRFFNAMIFWEDKRPITIEILKRLSLQSLARVLGREAEYEEIVKERGRPGYAAQITQLRMLEHCRSYEG